MQKPRSAAQVRQDFLDFFRGKGHEIVPSAPVVPGDDPTLYFTNAGMNQFKDVFLGTGTRPYTRVADTQKCMRVSGKHNDLEDVGHDHSHHTLFEMLGNWSFGDYYKEEAIAWAWELLTQVWGLDPARLHATVFTDDDEAAEIWKRYVVDEAHISRHGHKDNFWEMGDTGPCGPCTEIHYDMGAELASVPNSGPNVDDARFREIWNLVFIQYERRKDGTLEPLPSKHVDTGMGFERILTLLNGTTSTYATDLFQPTIQWVAKESGVAYDEGPAGTPHRVIADHLRAICFTIADGVTPSNAHRGYVVRRILRRAARYGRKLGLEKPFLFRLVPVLVDVMGEAFPELVKQRDHVTEVVQGEEERFSLALERGEREFEKMAAEIESRGETVVPGKDVFFLYGTHGFPMDLTRVMARERGWTVDEDEFERLFEEDKVRSKGGFQLDEAATRCAEGVPGTEFTGYEALGVKGATVLRVVPIAPEDQQQEGGHEFYAAFDRTPCYAESGGQVADRAWMTGLNCDAELIHCQKFGDVFVHRFFSEIEALPSEGDRVDLRVDPEARNRTMCNHTATHLLHAALRRVLGDHVNQAGSLVAPDRLRFDFVHPRALTPEEVAEVERLVNEQVRRDVPLEVQVMDRAQADSRGAMALFGEKYGETVRVVEVPGFSTELCGGTHVPRTGTILTFKLISQASVAANVRRVDCLAGPALVEHLAAQAGVLEGLAAQLGCAPAEVPERLEGLRNEVRKLKKDLAAARKAGASLDPAQLAQDAQEIPGRGFSLATAFAEGLTVPDLRDLSDSVLAKLGRGVVLLATSQEGKVNLVCKVDKGLTKDGVHAGNLIREVAEVVGGKGGGRPEMATAGGSDPSKIPAALERARAFLTGA